MTAQLSSTAERALTLLGQGMSQAVVASALGVTESAISQLVSDENFSAQVQELRFLNSQKKALLDEAYDDMESRLLGKLDKAIPLMTRPRDILQAISVINGAKRRSTSAPVEADERKTIVNLTIPVSVTHKYTQNIHNQILGVQDGQGNQKSLLTASSGSLDRLVREAQGITRLEKENGSQNESSNFPSAQLIKSDYPEAIEERLRKIRASKTAITTDDL